MPSILFLSVLWGLTALALIALSSNWGFHSRWVRLVVLVAICAVLALFDCLFLARGRALPRQPRDTQEVRKWTRVSGVCSALSLVCMVAVPVSMWLYVQRVSAALSTHETPDLDFMDRTFQWLIGGGLTVLAIGFIVFGISIWALVKSNRARFPKESSGQG